MLPVEQNNRPFAPKGAPSRTLWPDFVVVFLLFSTGIWSIGYLTDKTLGRAPAIAVGGALYFLLCYFIAAGVRELDRTGWYEYKPIIFSFPLIISERHLFTFEENGIRFDRGKWVSYEEIEKVKVICNGTRFYGIRIYLTDGKPTDTMFVVFLNKLLSRRLLYVTVGNRSGEPARTALAILRQKAPHARFKGPLWIGEGWVPRLGFDNPNSGGG